jgi:transcriptional regulator GlxA family with amidase domain
LVLFPGFQALDVFGPLDALNILSTQYQMNLSLIAETLDPVSNQPPGSEFNPKKSNFSERVVPTHTFANAPPLDVLIVPGGIGTRIPGIEPTVDFVAATYPQLQYIITVCTGSGILARTGHLDGKRATTNKNRWDLTTAMGPKVQWVKKARWVVDSNIWTSAGISAGIDVTLAFIKNLYGREVVDLVSNTMEYERHEDSSWDPFTAIFDAKK